MKDVAHAAGVSHQTVSRVLNGSPAVRDDTRARVLEAIERLGYRRNMAARALVSRRSGIIGVLAMESTLYGPTSTLYGVERAAREAGYFVSVTATDGAQVGAIDLAAERLVAQGVEGIVVIAPVATPTEALGDIPDDLPVVFTQGDGGTRATVTVDQSNGAELLTNHLLERGVRTVWHIAGPEGWIEADQRIAGWRRALQSAGANAPPAVRGDWSPASGYTLGKELVLNGDIDAVFVANDHMALGFLRALHEHGRVVPNDLLVAGFDDIPEAAYLTPPLTTVRQDFLAVGRHAIEVLLDEMAGRVGTRATAVPPELIIRASSTPVRSGAP